MKRRNKINGESETLIININFIDCVYKHHGTLPTINQSITFVELKNICKQATLQHHKNNQQRNKKQPYAVLKRPALIVEHEYGNQTNELHINCNY